MLDETCKVLEHLDIGAGYRYLVVAAPQMAAAMEPGQFAHVRVPSLEASAVRRPFSVFNAEDGRVTVLYKAVGRGTRALNEVAVGDELKIMSPLGHGFPKKCPPKMMLFVGGRTQADLLALDRFATIPGVEVRTATNDGSAGVKGLVTVPLDDELARLKAAGAPFELFACGPDPMLKAVAQRARDAKAPGWISMDRHMICGVGACYACVQKTVRGYSRCCIEGPVFRAEDLIFE